MVWETPSSRRAPSALSPRSHPLRLMRVEIMVRDREYARYFVYADAGRELRQVHRNVSREIAAAKRRKVSLAKVLAEVESAHP